MELVILSILLALVSSCSKEEVSSITREDIFTFKIGRLEDQIALYNLEGDQGIRQTNLTMREGLFYISDGNGEKVVRYNSYGDPLFMIYNEEKNPVPLTLRTLEHIPEDEVITRWAFTYPLEKPGKITVDSRKHIYVEDRLPYERHGFDSESKALLDNVVLHFDAEGRFVEYLGQEGIGGTPFPKIEGLYTSVNDDLVVVCRLPTGWNIYWFNSDGISLYLIKIGNNEIPIPPDRDMVFVSMDMIAAAPDVRKLYLKVDYYRYTYDESTNTRSGNEPDSSVIWVMNIESGFYEKIIEIPFFEYTLTENNQKVSVKMFYAMLGIIRNERIFFQVPVENGYALLILSGDSQEQRRGFIQIHDEELAFNVFDLSEDGLLSALLVSNWDIKLVWWRTDKFIENMSS
jgi:hypothetical protein